MARIIGVHGIGWQLEGEDVLTQKWLPALRSGLRRAGAPAEELPDQSQLAAAFYGDLFRSRGKMALGEPDLDASDVEAGDEADLLIEWWHAAADVDSNVRG